MLLLAFFSGIFFQQINDIVPFLVPLVLTKANQVRKSTGVSFI